MVRPSSNKQTIDRMIEAINQYKLDYLTNHMNSRIQLIEGDLELPLLGLSQELFDELSNDIDFIVHNGALVYLKHFKI